MLNLFIRNRSIIFLLVIRNKSLPLIFLYVGLHSITFLMKITNCWHALSSLLQAEYMGVWQGTRNDLTKAVNQLLTHLGTAALWTNYSLRGVRGKRALDQTKIYDLIKSRSQSLFLRNCSIVCFTQTFMPVYIYIVYFTYKHINP